MIPIDVDIRRAIPKDNDLLSRLGRQTFLDTFSAGNRPEDMAAYLDASFSPEKQASELADPLSVFLIAEINGEAAGYARLLHARAPSVIRARHPIQLVRLYADKRWVGRGVGAALMTACIALAQQQKCDGIWLGVWEENSRALGFYRKWGFSDMGTQHFLLGNDRQIDIIIWLPLEPVSAA